MIEKNQVDNSYYRSVLAEAESQRAQRKQTESERPEPRSVQRRAGAEMRGPASLAEKQKVRHSRTTHRRVAPVRNSTAAFHPSNS